MKLQTWVLGFLGLALSCVAQSTSAATAATALYFSGPTGEYVSQGQQYFLDVAHGYQVLVNNLNNADSRISFYFNNLSTAPPSKQHSWTVAFSASNGGVLQPGIYLNATRQAFATVGPGLDLYGDGRGNNAVKGYFSVLQAVYDAQGNVVQFAADFVLQGDTPGKIFGSVRYNSDVQLVRSLR
jgi:hypothetical protein